MDREVWLAEVGRVKAELRAMGYIAPQDLPPVDDRTPTGSTEQALAALGAINVNRSPAPTMDFKTFMSFVDARGIDQGTLKNAITAAGGVTGGQADLLNPTNGVELVAETARLLGFEA
jgi:hypothetical protein